MVTPHICTKSRSTLAAKLVSACTGVHNTNTQTYVHPRKTPHLPTHTHSLRKNLSRQRLRESRAIGLRRGAHDGRRGGELVGGLHVHSIRKFWHACAMTLLHGCSLSFRWSRSDQFNVHKTQYSLGAVLRSFVIVPAVEDRGMYWPCAHPWTICRRQFQN